MGILDKVIAILHNIRYNIGIFMQQPRTIIERGKRYMTERKIYAQSLYELVILKKEVNSWDLTEACEGIYRSVKVVGIKNTVIRYLPEGESTEVYMTGDEIPMEMRAIAALCVQLLNRWTDSNMGRLETHFGLPTTIGNILINTDIFKNTSTTLPCICINDVIAKYLGI